MLRVPNAPPIDPQDDGTTDAFPARPDLLPVAHPVGSDSAAPPAPTRRHSALPREEDEEEEETASASSRKIWLGLAFFVAVLGTCACCGLAAVLLPPPDWQEHESAKGGFRVELPGEPRSDMAQRVRTQPGRNHKGVEGTYLWTRVENYIIAYRDIERDGKKGKKSAAEILDEEVTAITSDANIVQPLDRNDTIEVQGCPAREFEYQFKNGGVITGRVIIADTRVYVLVAGGKFTGSDDENVRRFLDSFEITDQKLLERAWKRPEAKKQD